MGVAIHSLTVEEIAISVVAELIATRRGALHPNSLSVTQGIADKMTTEGRHPERSEGSSPFQQDPSLRSG